jgi:hypothetical protein
MIEMPPYDRSDEPLVPEGTGYLRGRLSDKRDWFAATPVVVTLRDGVVLSAREEQRDAGKVAFARGFSAEAAEAAEAAKAAKAAEAAGAGGAVGTAGAKGAIHVKGPRGEFDFGYVKPKSKHSVVFVVHNPTSRTLAIRKVRSECKCMLAPNPPKEIPAGGKSLVRVDFVAPKDRMRYSKRILLQTGDAKYPLVTLRVKADVGLPLEAVPKTVVLGAIRPGQKRQGKVTIRNRGGKPVRPIYSTSTVPGCLALIPRAQIPAGGELEIPLSVRAAAGATGARRATVRIHTDCAAQPRVDLEVRFTITTAAGPGGAGAEGRLAVESGARKESTR